MVHKFLSRNSRSWMIPSFRSSDYVTLAFLLCGALPTISYADDALNLAVASPSTGDDSVVIYDNETGAAIAANPSTNSLTINSLSDAAPASVTPTKSAVRNGSVIIDSSAAPQAALPSAPKLKMALEIFNEAPPVRSNSSVIVDQGAAPQVAAKSASRMANVPEVSKVELVQPVAEPDPAPVSVLKAQPIRGDIAPQKIPVEAIEGDGINSAWQTQFIRNLTGSDGVLTLDLQPVSQDERVQDTVRLDEAVSIALQNNNELKASIEEAKSREWDTIGTYSQYTPTVSLDVAAGREHSRPASYNDTSGNRVLDNRHGRRDRSLLVRQPIIDLGVIADIFSAKDKQGVADISKIETQNTVALGTVTSYLKLLQSQVAIQLADQYRVYLDGLIKVMQTRVDAGGATAADLDRVISRSTLAESARMEAAGEFEINLAEFKRLTGVMPTKIIVPSRLAPDFPSDVAIASKRAYVNNPGYLASLKKIDVAKDERHKNYSNMLPKVYAQYSGVYSYNAGGAANAPAVDGIYATQRTDSAMIVAQWSMNGLTPIAGSLSAGSKENAAYFQSLDVRKRMDQAINANYTAVNSTKKRLAVLQKTVEANERVVEGFEAQYKSGTRSLFDLLDAYEQLYNSRLNLTRVIFAYTLASYQIRQQMGEIVPSIIDIKG